MRVLTIGDTHVIKETIDESRSLFELIKNTAKEEKPDFIVFLGDDLDSFGSTSVLCQTFLVIEAQELSKLCPVVFILGNHSLDPNNPECHSLLPLKFIPNVTVVDKPTTLFGIDFMPYRKSEKQFLEEECKLPNSLLFCHQPFLHSQFETGYTDTKSLDVELTRHMKIISGHIHKEGHVNKCYYPGAPRWMKRSDANQDKFVSIYNTITDEWTKIPTWPAVKKIIQINVKEGDIFPILDEMNTKYILIAEGTEDFLEKITNLYSGKAEIKTIPLRQAKVQLREKSNSIRALNEYLAECYQPVYNIDRKDLIAEINKRMQELK